MPRDDKDEPELSTGLPDQDVQDRLAASEELHRQILEEEEQDTTRLKWGHLDMDHQEFLDEASFQTPPDADALVKEREDFGVAADQLKQDCKEFSERTGWNDLLLDNPPKGISDEDREEGRDLLRRRLDIGRERGLLERRFDQMVGDSWRQMDGSDEQGLPDKRGLIELLEQKGQQISNDADPGQKPSKDYKRFLKDAREAYNNKLDTRQQREFVNLVGGRDAMKSDDFMNKKAIAFLDRHTNLLSIEDRQDNGRRVQMQAVPDSKSLTVSYAWRVAEIGGGTLAKGQDRSREGAAEALGQARDRHKARPRDRSKKLMPATPDDQRVQDKEKTREDEDRPFEVMDIEDPDFDPGPREAKARGKRRDRGSDLSDDF